MDSGRDDAALPASGFPIRVSADQGLFSTSPWLIAAVHALLRLLMPRHPPYALHILTVIASGQANPSGPVDLPLANYAVYKVRRGRDPGISGAGLSKLHSMGDEVKAR